MYGYGFRTRLRIPESGRDAVRYALFALINFVSVYLVPRLRRWKEGSRFATSSFLANAAGQVAPRGISPISRISRKSRKKLEIVAPRKPITVLFRGNLEIQKY